jgi:hypothetical protein
MLAQDAHALHVLRGVNTQHMVESRRRRLVLQQMRQEGRRVAVERLYDRWQSALVFRMGPARVVPAAVGM